MDRHTGRQAGRQAGKLKGRQSLPGVKRTATACGDSLRDTWTINLHVQQPNQHSQLILLTLDTAQMQCTASNTHAFKHCKGSIELLGKHQAIRARHRQEDVCMCNDKLLEILTCIATTTGVM